MTWVKICGITNLEDALVAVDAGADAVGFVFYAKSSRKVDVETVGPIVARLPKSVEKVGVFVKEEADVIRETVEGAGLTVVQTYGGAEIGLFNENIFGVGVSVRDRVGVDKLILGCPARGLQHCDLGENARQRIHALLIDSGSTVDPGGTGKRFDWQLVRETIKRWNLVLPIVIAGGLDPTNVPEAVRFFEPFGVDVSSGVEAQPGKKDPQKVRAFVRAVQKADQRAG
jgi:phosphoribosylanthranilate isomerase